jgi:hypothetical protein
MCRSCSDIWERFSGLHSTTAIFTKINRDLLDFQTLIDEINDELIDAYYTEMEKPVEETTEETVVENTEPVEEVTEETEPTEETTEEDKEETVVENTEPVQEEPVKEDVSEEKTEEDKEDKEEVLTKEVINSAKGNIPMDKSDLMKLHGDKFFAALYKNKKNLM